MPHGLGMDGGYEHSATSDSLAQPLSTSASREVHAAATAHTPALPTFQQHSSESCAFASSTRETVWTAVPCRNRYESLSEWLITHIGIANCPTSESLRIPISERLIIHVNRYYFHDRNRVRLL